MYKPGDKVQFTLMLYKYELEKTILLVKKGCIYFTDNSKINFFTDYEDFSVYSESTGRYYNGWLDTKVTNVHTVEVD